MRQIPMLREFWHMFACTPGDYDERPSAINFLVQSGESSAAVNAYSHMIPRRGCCPWRVGTPVSLNAGEQRLAPAQADERRPMRPPFAPFVARRPAAYGTMFLG